MEKIKNTKDEILESLFLKQTKIVNFEEFEAEIDEQIYLYKTYIDEINKVFGWISKKVSMNQEKQRFKIMKKCKK